MKLISVFLLAYATLTSSLRPPRALSPRFLAIPKRNTVLGVFSGISEKLGGIVELISGQDVITEANIEDTLKEVKTILIDSDVNLQVTDSLIEKVKQGAIGMKVDPKQKPGEQFISLLAAELVDTMGKEQAPLQAH